VCECQYDILDPESLGGELCLQVHTNMECTPGYCSANTRLGFYCFGSSAIVANSSDHVLDYDLYY
jgi:hypothetical protein